MQNVRKKNGTIEISRFVAIILIMAHHTYHMGLGFSNPFKLAWIFVEFFFVLSGYFTVKHFRSREDSITNPGKEALGYTLNKFKPFIPFIIIAVLIEYFCIFKNNGISLKFGISLINDMPFEIGFLSTASSTEVPAVAPLWYLSAMFLVFPLFCLFIQIKNKYLFYFVSFLAPVLYYGAFGVSGKWEYPHYLLRTAASLLLGGVVYGIVESFKKVELKPITTVIVHLVNIGCIVSVIGLTYTNIEANRFILLAFILYLINVLSGRCILNSTSNPVITFIGKITMPMFLFHWPIGSLINIAIPNAGGKLKLIVYYAGTIILSIVLYFVINACKKLPIFQKKFWIKEKI